MDADLRALLAHYPASAQPLSAPEALGGAGGHSGSRLWRYRAGRSMLAVRAWPTDGPAPARLARIHGWLGEAARVGFIPVPLPARDGRTFRECHGRLWEIGPWMPGAVEPARPPAPARLRAAFAALAAFHQALAHHRISGPSPNLGVRLREIEALERGEFDRLERGIAARPDDPIGEPARRWLHLARRLAPEIGRSSRGAGGSVVPLQPCLRDARPEHVLFAGDRVVGLVDFGAMDVDSVGADLARLMSEWLGDDRDSRRAALAAYTSVRPLGEREVALIAAFERTAMVLGAAHWIRWHFVERRGFDDPGAVRRGIERGLEHLAGMAAAGTVR